MSDSVNNSIEIHDSILKSVETTRTRLELFIEAYIHKSEGEPGVDPGTGWSQNIRLRIDEGSLDGNITGMPWDLADGTLRINDQVLKNMIPIPLEHDGQIELTLMDQKSGERIVARGSHISLAFLDEAQYIEEFR